MNDPNPYESPNTSTARSSRGLWPYSWQTFTFAFAIVFVLALFVPSGPIMQGNTEIGRLRLWMAYLGLLDLKSFTIALPIVIAHLSVAAILAWLADRLLKRNRNYSETGSE